MTELNSSQKSAVTYLGGPLLVLAGAGSGKTRVITHKIAHLIGECGIGARHICAVTFTNKAAREMKARVAHRLKGRDARGLTISTFHTLGLNILRRDAGLAGYRAGFSLFDTQDSESILKEHLHKTKQEGTTTPGAVQASISRWKNDLTSPAFMRPTSAACAPITQWTSMT